MIIVGVILLVFLIGTILIATKLANPDTPTQDELEEVPSEGPGEWCHTLHGDPDTIGPMYNRWLAKKPNVVVRETRVVPVYGGTFMYIFYSNKE